jgi:hypothetical protein
MKKLIITLVVTLAAAIAFFAGNRQDRSIADESVISGKDAELAGKFTQYIHRYAKENRIDKFSRRFKAVPTEEQRRIWETLAAVDNLGQPLKVTVPATGKTRRCIYYRKDSDKAYKFIVSAKQNKWRFQQLVEVNNI